MTYARSEIVTDGEVGLYHCVSRCVRRAFLCGKDSLSGRSFEHRRLWIRSRLSTLTEIFAIEVFAYAVMSNHLHSLIRVRPDVAEKWSPEEVARRWRTLFPLRRINGVAAKPNEEEIAALVLQRDKISLYRSRLANISWFNRCLNENIARRANAEDECKGRFWEGRFKCQRIFDLGAVLACAAYIDLNPIRAGLAKTIESSDHTSIQDRIDLRNRQPPKRRANWPHVPLISIPQMTNGLLTLNDYLSLVDQTGRMIVEGKSHLSPEIAPILDRLRVKATAWLATTEHFKRKFRRVVGTEDDLRRAAARIGREWFHGIQSARAAFQS